jgi:hypothetical protein
MHRAAAPLAASTNPAAGMLGSILPWRANTSFQMPYPACQQLFTVFASHEQVAPAAPPLGTVSLLTGSLPGSSTPPAAAPSPSGQTLALPATETIAFGRNHYITLHSDGVVACTGDCVAPVPDVLQGQTAAIAAGNAFSVALQVTGAPVVWGGTAAQNAIPACAAIGVIAIAAGDMHIMALRQDGRVCVWCAEPWKTNCFLCHTPDVQHRSPAGTQSLHCYSSSVQG